MCEYRKKHICEIWPAARKMLLTLLLCASVMSAFLLSVSAAGTVIATATIPVSVTVSTEEGTGGTAADTGEESFTFRLTALDNAPMPENDTIVITGAGSAEFVIDYETVGVYRYTVEQEIGSSAADEEASDGLVRSCDDTVYYVVVTVQNAEDAGIGVTVVAHKGSVDGMKSDILFENSVMLKEAETEESPSKAAKESTSEATETEETTSEATENTAETAAEESTETEEPPQTGDDTPVGFWIALLAVSFVLATRSWLCGQRKEKNGF